jgi:hypothetical protein
MLISLLAADEPLRAGHKVRCLETFIAEHFSDSRQGLNTQFRLRDEKICPYVAGFGV